MANITMLYSDGGVPEKDMLAAHEHAAGGRSVIRLSARESLYHMERVQNMDSRVWEYLVEVFPFLKGRVIEGRQALLSDMIRKEGSGVQHIAGLLDMTLKLSSYGVPIVWRHPESFLHPKAQLNLADVVIRLSKLP